MKNNFTSYCTTQGLQMKHIVPYTSQQNDIAERKNYTLKYMTNCVIQSKGLSFNSWEKSIKCTNYIVNRTLTKALKNALEEAWIKINSDASHTMYFSV
jgi:hypothetical protein